MTPHAPCPHCREAFEELEERLRRVDAVLAGDGIVAPSSFGRLGPHVGLVFQMLMARTTLTLEGYAIARDGDGLTDPEASLSVGVCKLRKIFAKHGLTIETVAPAGYSISDKAKTLIREMRERPDVDANEAVRRALLDSPAGLGRLDLERLTGLSEQRVERALSRLTGEIGVRTETVFCLQGRAA